MPITNVLTVCGLAFAAAVAAVPVVRQFARGGGLYEQPVKDRWHSRPVPKLGGVAMAMAFFAVAWWVARDPPLVALLVATGSLGILGLIDDLHPLGPVGKFAGQFAAAGLFLWWAPSINLTGEPAVDAVLAFLWFVGITNAFNLLDNIDGAAAGIAAIAGTFFVIALLANGAGSLANLAALVAAMSGVALGFLVYNWHPASIFMGDSGSHLVGSFFAGATILAAPHMHPHSEVGVAIGVVLLFVPCADTALVVLTRQLAGRSAFVGGRDHLSHRIVALGLDEGRAVLVLYGMAIAGGLVALGLQNLDEAVGWMLAVAYGGGVAAIGVYLGHVNVHAAAKDRVAQLLPSELTRRYGVYEVLTDAVLVGFAYYVGVLVRFGDSPDLGVFLRSVFRMLPLIVICYVAALWMSGKYRAGARGGIRDVRIIVQGVLAGSAASVIAVLYITRFQLYSRQAFAISTGLCLLFLAGGRLVLQAGDDVLGRRLLRGPLAIIYGAGRRGALAAQELKARRGTAVQPLGLIDDDPSRRNERIEGLPVLGTLEHLDMLLARHPGLVTTVVVSIRALPLVHFEELCATCERHGVEVQQFRFAFEEVDLVRRDRPGRVIRFPCA